MNQRERYNPTNPSLALTVKATKSRMSANTAAIHPTVAISDAKTNPNRCAPRATRSARPVIPAATGCRINALLALFRVLAVLELNG